ncbi:MAG: hypothetical protein KAU95_01980 [Candidatus Aenigmarchaeota archaeon]|nr:hypothetical protein [Candidatus Aenigmarchaeota archaeon]
MRARFCGEFNKEGVEAKNLIRNAGFRVSFTPVSGIELEMNYGSQTYCGLQEIKEFAEYYKKTEEILNNRGKYIL